MSELHCPSARELTDFETGRLPEDRASAIGEHIDTCDSCQSLLETSSHGDDAVVAALRRPAATDTAAEEPGLQRLQSPEFLKYFAGFDSATSGGASLVGTKLGSYQLLERIATGGMGTVYKARHVRLGRIVALKVLPDHRQHDDATVARFSREMTAIGSLSHRNIVVATDAGEHAGKHFLVMEYVEGADLATVIKRHGPLRMADAVACIVQAAAGLRHAHVHGIVHRDIKPANLLLARDGTIKILDMGLALLDTRYSSMELRLTQSAQVMGTLEFIAPEQGMASHEVDVRADIYSLGATLFKLLCGEAPFPTSQYDTPIKMMAAIVHGEAPSIGEKQDVPKTLAAVVDRMLKRDPQQRFSSPQQVVDALEPFAEGADLTGLVQAPGHHERLVSAGTLDQSSSASVDVGQRPRQWKLDRDGKPARRRRRRTALAVVTGMLGLFLAAAIVVFIRGEHATVRLEINDPSIEVALSGDDRLHIKGKDAEFDITPGPHTLRVAVGDAEFETQEFTVRENQQLTLRVTLLEGKTVRVVAGEKLLDEYALPQPTGAAPVSNPVRWPADAPPPAIAPFDAQQAKAHQLAWATYLELPVERSVEVPGGATITFVLIPPGEFVMGSSKAVQSHFIERADDRISYYMIQNEGPPHRVQISRPFYLGKTEVTQAQWESVMARNPASFEDPQNPVERINWNTMQDFLVTLNKAAVDHGFEFALPTEAQWEYACRAGTTTHWSWGDLETEFREFAWCAENTNDGTSAVGQLKPNPWGLHDMHGNVWEVCSDWHDPHFYSVSPINDPLGPAEPSAVTGRVSRGGSWRNSVNVSRSAYRDRVGWPEAYIRLNHVGLRLTLLVNTGLPKD